MVELLGHVQQMSSHNSASLYALGGGFEG